jgi:catechol 2,3-dioxygenase-like lactoylglutathione lyase family enzyme
MRLHHVALFTPHPSHLASFYAEIFGLDVTRVNDDAAGVRSVWLQSDATILMVERGERGRNGVLVFAAEPGSAPHWSARFAGIEDGATEFTLYARDPDGNRCGVSSYPAPIRS